MGHNLKPFQFVSQFLLIIRVVILDYKNKCVFVFVNVGLTRDDLIGQT